MPASRKKKSPAAPDLSFRPAAYRWPRKSSKRARNATGDEAVIARIALSTSPREVVTLRAKRTADGRIRYRLIHEENRSRHPIRTTRSSSDRPLALGEVIEMLDAACYHGACADPDDQHRYGGLIWGTLQLHFEHGVGHAESYYPFATITSDAYPQLEAYYLQRMSEWCLEHCVEHEDCRRIVRLRLNRG